MHFMSVKPFYGFMVLWLVLEVVLKVLVGVAVWLYDIMASSSYSSSMAL